MDERAMPREGRSGGTWREGDGGIEIKVSAARMLVEG
jgi:hypothetical protein